MAEAARLRLFGDFALEDPSGRPIALPLRKAEAVLAYLALAPDRSSTREKLAGLLWGDSDQQRARHNLRQVLFALSKAFAQLDPPLLHLESQSVRLADDALIVDAVEFNRLLAEGSPEALSRACDLYNGEFLSGFSVDALEFEEWLAATCRLFRDAAMRALSELLKVQEKSGRLDQAIETAARALRIDTLREDIHRHLMRLYAAKGMRSSALSQYRSCREILQRELGVHPDEETTKLYREILEQGNEGPGADVGLHGGAGGADELAHLTDRIARLTEASDGLSVGRDAELDRLKCLTDAVCQTGVRMALVSGEPGVGKSHLLNAFACDVARGGAAVLMSRGRLVEHPLPLELWTDVLEDLRARGDDGPREDVLRSLQQSLRGVGSSLGATDGGVPRALCEALVDAMRQVARDHLLVLVFDDLHCADEESLRLLYYAVRNLRASPVLVVGAAESEALGRTHLLRDLLRDVERDGLLTPIDLEPLPRERSIELAWQLQQALGVKRDAKARLNRFWLMSEGNPRVIREAVLTAAARDDCGQSDDPPLPPAVLDELALRKIRLGEAAQRLMSVAAIIGRRANYEVVIRAAAVGEDQAADALEELVAERILRADGETVVFIHNRVALAAYEGLLAPRRKLLHAAVARAIEEIHAGKLEPHYQEVARHYREAGDGRKALAFGLEAARMEVNRGLPTSARRLFQSTVEAARDIDGDEETVRMVIEAHLGLAALAEIEENRDRVAASLDAAEVLAARHGEPGQLGRLLAARSRLEWARGAEKRAYQLACRALAESERSGASSLWLPSERLVAHLHLAAAANARVLDRMERRRTRSAKLGLRQDEAEVAAVLGLLHAIRGEFAEASRSCEQAVGIAEAVIEESCMTACLQARGIVECWRGDSEAARATFDKALKTTRARGDLPRRYALTGLNGYALLAAGRAEQAVAALQEALSMGKRLNTGLFAALFQAWLAEAAVGLVGDEDALRLGREALRRASESNQAWAGSIASRALARVLVRPGYRDLHAADQSIRSAIAIQTGLALRYETARSMVVHAKILRAQGNARRSSEIFARASEMFAQIGLGTDFERARTMAEALRPVPEGPA